jgi:tRNA A-37 threonylcarbamoyl transferase component Bud32
MLADQLTWGAVPEGFVRWSDGKGGRMIVRRGRERQIKIDICFAEDGQSEVSGYQGRAALRRIHMSNGANALVRQCRHGGTLRGLTGPWFFTWPPRPFRELTLTEELRRRGVPTVEVLAACAIRGVGPFYRGCLVTRELADSEDLWSALQSGLVARLGWQNTLQAVAASVRAMHREGVFHGDLNLKNILVRPEESAVASYIIDFDKAKLFLGKLPAELVKRNLDRLHRSARKLDPHENFFSATAWQEFVNFYHDDATG